MLYNMSLNLTIYFFTIDVELHGCIENYNVFNKGPFDKQFAY